MRLSALVSAALLLSACGSPDPPSNTAADGAVRRMIMQNMLHPPYAKAPPAPMRR